MAAKGVEYQRQSDGSDKPILAGQAQNWTTPKASDGEKGGPNMRGSKGDLPLPAQSAQWPTPTASLTNDGEDPAQWQARADRIKLTAKNGNGAGMPLTVASAAWPTPNAAVIEAKSRPPIIGARRATDPQIGLADVAVHCFEHWPTPGAGDDRGPSTGWEAAADRHAANGAHKQMMLRDAAPRFSPQVQPTDLGLTFSPRPPGSPRPSASRSTKMPRLLSRRLNPYFVEWLMGWPMGWTSTSGRHASRRVVTELWRSKLQLRLSSLLDEPALREAA